MQRGKSIESNQSIHVATVPIRNSVNVPHQVKCFWIPHADFHEVKGLTCWPAVNSKNTLIVLKYIDFANLYTTVASKNPTIYFGPQLKLTVNQFIVVLKNCQNN